MTAVKKAAGRVFGLISVLFVCILLFPVFAANETSEEFFSPKAETKSTIFGLSLRWEDVPDAEFYRIWRKESGKPVLLDETTAHIWLDKEAPKGPGHRYAVTCVDKNGNETKPVWQYVCYLEMPKPRVCEVLGGFCIEWDAVEGAKEYEIARKAPGGSWETVATTKILSYTDAEVPPTEGYTYSVTAKWQKYSSHAGKSRAEVLIGTPERLGSVPEGFTASVYGESGAGRELYVYTKGSGENVLLLTFALHGWEDAFPRDGRAHVFTAYRLMNALKDVDTSGWTIYIVPLANPDGLIDGSGNYGPGRCTTKMLDWNGNTVSCGVDLNRCFPAYWRSYEYGRNFNGSAPLACSEAVALAELMKNCKGDGRNVYVDVHGWTEQVIIASWSWSEYWAFASRFPTCTLAHCRASSGYASAYAADLGYSSGLFEFPYRYSRLSSFVQSDLPETFIRAVCDILDG